MIDYVGQQPEAQLDRSGDPRVGMAGGSYGGGIQLVTAATDPRVDAITPDIAWNSLVTSLYKEQSPKAGWSNLLFGLGVASSTVPGLAAGETGNLDPHIASAYQSGLTTGTISDEDVSWFASRGPGRARRPDQGTDAPDPGDRRHALHARRGDPQLQRPAQEPRADAR